MLVSVIGAYQNSKTIKDITDHENLPRSTVSNIINGFLKNGEINKKEKSGKKHEKITEDAKQYTVCQKSLFAPIKNMYLLCLKT